MVFLFYSLSSVLVIMFSLVSASSNIQGELPTSKRRPWIFRKNANFFFALLNKNANLSYWRKENLIFVRKRFRWPFKIGKFHLCSKRQYRDKERAIWGLRGFFCIFVQKDDKEIRRGQYMRAEGTFCSCCHWPGTAATF